MAGVGTARIGRHRRDGGITVDQASSDFLHLFNLKQAMDAVVEQNAEALLNFENAQTGLSSQLRDARRLRRINQRQTLRPQRSLTSHRVEVAGKATGVFAMFVQHQTKYGQTLPLQPWCRRPLFMTETAMHARQRATQSPSR